MKAIGRFLRIAFVCLIMVLNHAVYAQIVCTNYPELQKIEIQFSLPEFDVKDTILPLGYGTPLTFSYIIVHNNSFGIIDSVGFPELPQLTIDINIPCNTDNYVIETSHCVSNTISLKNHILPHQNDISKEGSNFQLSFCQDQSFYSSGGPFIKRLCSVSDDYYIHDKRGISISITPFCYDPITKKLQITSSATITLSYSLDSQPDNTEGLSDVWEEFYGRLFPNYTPTIRGNRSSGRYLMIVPEQYSDNIQPFITYKQTLGYDVDLRTIQPSEATSSNIKSIIQNKYDNSGSRPDFILLVGDYEDIPAYSGDISAMDSNNPITDVPYAFLHGDDLMVDAYIGRWPIHNTTELQTIINKTIYMEINMHLWEKKAVFVSGDDSNSLMLLMFRTAHDDVSNNSFAPNGFSCQMQRQPMEYTALSALNNNPWLYAYSGHGSFYKIGVVHQNSSFYIDSFFIENSSHELYPMLFVFACRTGNFAADLCYSIAEQWIVSPKGAATYLGSSVNTLTYSDDIIERKMLGEAFFEETYIGSVIAKGMQKYRTYLLEDKKNKERYTKSYNLMGDPSFHVNGWGCSHDYWITDMNLKNGDNQYYRAENTITIYGSNSIGPGSSLSLTAGQEIVFGDGFEASAGAELTASIQPCDPNISAKQSETHPLSNFEEKQEQSFSVISLTDNPSDVKIYPNPAHDNIKIEYILDQTAFVSVEIYDLFGNVVMKIPGTQKQKGYNVESVEIESLLPGCYFICFTNGYNKYMKCLIKN